MIQLLEPVNRLVRVLAIQTVYARTTKMDSVALVSTVSMEMEKNV